MRGTLRALRGYVVEAQKAVQQQHGKMTETALHEFRGYFNPIRDKAKRPAP